MTSATRPLGMEWCRHRKGFLCNGKQRQIAAVRGADAVWVGVAAGCPCGFRGPLSVYVCCDEDGLMGAAVRRLREVGDELSGNI
jgi:hypothetical protein